MHLVSFWPSPTPRARRERQWGASGVRWWVGAARFCVQEGCFFPCKIMTPFSPHLTPPRLRTGESMHLVSFWPSPTPRARRGRQWGASGVRWWVRTARFCVREGCFFPCEMILVSPHSTPPRLHTGEDQKPVDLNRLGDSRRVRHNAGRPLFFSSARCVIIVLEFETLLAEWGANDDEAADMAAQLVDRYRTTDTQSSRKK
jgi:hypothetical protein